MLIYTINYFTRPYCEDLFIINSYFYAFESNQIKYFPHLVLCSKVNLNSNKTRYFGNSNQPL